MIAEKDFWVCWLLGKVFATPDIPTLIFKGGTSLSKAYALIDRFSEDIDLAFDRAALGFEGDRDPLQISGVNARNRVLDELTEASRAVIRDAFVPALESAVGAALSGTPNMVVDLPGQVVTFAYPQAFDAEEYGADDYVLPSVKLELGARSDQYPAEERGIRSYAAEHFPDLFSAPACTVRTLAAERTFWEKATILHVEPNRPLESRATGWQRLSRHAYDLVMMSERGVADRAIARIDLLPAVCDHKAAFFSRGWAEYQTAKSGSLRLMPRDEFAGAMRRDYRAMREMFFSEPPAWERILAELQSLEVRINEIVSS